MIPVPAAKQEFEIEITDIAYGGRGVGRYDGKVIFVPHVLPGEIVKVRQIKEKPNYTLAEVVKILQPSPERIESNCLIPVGKDFTGKEHFVQTPGCAYQNFSYKEEIRVKDNQFKDFIQPLFDKINPPTVSPKPLHYRNKITLHTMDDHGDISLGYCEEKGINVVDMPACPLAVDEINAELSEIRSKQGFKNTIRDGMTVTLRFTENDGVKWWRNNPQNNASWLKEKTCVGDLSVPCGSFFQVNMAVADIVLKKVTAHIKRFSPFSVIDLYCGCGLFSIASAVAGVDNIAGLDSDPDAVNAARFNAKQQDIGNAFFSSGLAKFGFSKLIEEQNEICNYDFSKTLLIVDPPRNGLSIRVHEVIKRSDFMGIIYISCAPDTLQRDLQKLTNTGYSIISAEMLDMFPRTSHFESLVVLER